ncbi:DUF5082 family protein [Salicibibacter cibarius]|uniref:DUF5082 family protein n=1 Tax=Salicibibacter cibarius TaxID=2743000 RepID=A0A7T7CD27_9BACI|nr:DUF5082 family protein [Salicibibacter cibarius]QQK77579.1 DUF5082 family protein [Salicibibacter cibarius]
MSEERLRSQISSAEGTLASAREDLQRLQECRARLISRQSTLDSAKSDFKEPELTADTWHGEHATKFDDIRDSGIVTPYDNLADVKVPEAIDQVDARIDQTNNLITQQITQLDGLKDSLEKEIKED